MISICLLGNGGGKIKETSDISVIVPSDITSHIQDIHIVIIHSFLELIEENLFHL